MTTFQANQMPILANPMSISAQSEDICLHNLGTSPLYGMVPSPIGVRNSSHPVTIQCHPVAIQCKLDANPGPLLVTTQSQPDPFFVNSSQSSTNPVPIWCQSKVNFSIQCQFSNFQKWSIRANPSQSNANPMPLLRTFHSVPICCQSAN